MGRPRLTKKQKIDNLYMRYGEDVVCSCEQMKLKDFAAKYGISYEYARQIKKMLEAAE